MHKHARLCYNQVLRLIIMKWLVYEHDMLKRKTVQLGFCPSLILHAIFGSLMYIFGQTSKHESCSILSLVFIGSNFSFIAIMVCEI